ncbi:MAG: hypothetical protein IPK83_14050 [Planctomycetes bacterium]|nr:hypothetical protein [Planctomycetota bacterium]
MTTYKPLLPVGQGTRHVRRTVVSQAPRDPVFGFRRWSWFHVGDAIFLAAVGAESGVVMQWLHQLEWNFLVLSVLGMAAAMGVQMVLAFSLSPLLCSIETMAPSMVVAMVVPMLVDVAEVSGWMFGRFDAAVVGAASGFLFFVYLEWYGAIFRRRLARACSAGAVR